MMNKFMLSLFAVILLVSFASAAVLETDLVSAPASVAHNAGSFVINFNVSYTGTQANGVDVTFAPSATAGTATFSSIPVTHLNQNEVKNLSLTVNFPANQPGPIAGTIAASSGASTDSFSFSVVIAASSTLALDAIPLKVNQSGTLTVTNRGNTVLNSILLNATSIVPISFSTNNFNLAAGNSQSVTISGTDFSALKFGTSTVTIRAASGSVQNSVSFPIQKSFCSNGMVGNNLTISSVDINSNGDEDETWRPLDKITVEVDVDNDGGNDIKDVTLELGLFEDDGRNAVKDFDFTNTDKEKIKLNRINDDDSKTGTFEFKVPADVELGNYKLAVKAYSKDLGESRMCGDSSSDLSQNIYQDVEVEREDEEEKFIAFDNVRFSPQEATCGDSVTASFDVVNVGDDDQDQVKINIRSSELKINTFAEIKEDLDQGDKKSESFTFTLPSGLTDKLYPIVLSSEYDYDNGVYDQSSEDTLVYFKVFGCTAFAPSTSRIADITASLDSDAVAGQELTVVSTVRNLGSTTMTFIVNPTGFESWADLKETSSRILTLGAGESKSLEMVFNVDEDASGEKSFFIEVQSGDKTERREVSVNLEESTQSLGSLFKGNSLIWVIGLVNLVLIIIIIIVAVKVSRR